MRKSQILALDVSKISVPIDINVTLKSEENIIYKRRGGNKVLKLFKKTLAICLIGLGLGILLVLLLPVTGWLFIIGVVVVCVGFMWLAC